MNDKLNAADTRRIVCRKDPQSQGETHYAFDLPEYEALINGGIDPEIVDEAVLRERSRHVYVFDGLGRVITEVSRPSEVTTTVFSF